MKQSEDQRTQKREKKKKRSNNSLIFINTFTESLNSSHNFPRNFGLRMKIQGLGPEQQLGPEPSLLLPSAAGLHPNRAALLQLLGRRARDQLGGVPPVAALPWGLAGEEEFGGRGEAVNGGGNRIGSRGRRLVELELEKSFPET